MARLRRTKLALKHLLRQEEWENHLGEIAEGGMANVGALFSFLPQDPDFTHRAAKALGLAIAKIALQNPDGAKEIVRRFMWQMNEDSGNIGWGIPEAFAETLAASHGLARAYGNILVSYIMDLGHADNYCDHAPLRRSCYWAVGRFAQAWPDLAEKSRPWLIRGLSDDDEVCQGMAAWALGELGPGIMDAPALNALARSGNNSPCKIFDGHKTQTVQANELAKRSLALIH